MAGGQHGQAVVGVMVVMLLLFAMAGAVAVGASTLFASHGQSGAAVDDFRVRSAVGDSVAQVAGSTLRCGAPPPLPSPSPTPTPTAPATPLALTLPPNGASTLAYCAREDYVVQDTLQNHTVSTAKLPGCATFDLGTPGAVREAVFFDARLTTAGWAYIDDNQKTPPCTSAPPNGAPAPPCLESFNGSKTAVTQVALSCVFLSGETVYLHVNVSDVWPRLVFTAQQDPKGSSNTVGSLYLLAAGTGLPSPDYEESVFFVRDDLQVNSLLYEAPLPS
jgi:hypothetical protein